MCLTAASGSGARELELPRRSPYARVSQQVGLTRISVDYSSLAARGGEIWGHRVPLGRLWLDGETPAPRVTFSREVIIGGRPVPAGTYALLSIPGPTQWTVIVNRDAELMVSRREHQPAQDVARVEAPVEPADYRERLVFYFADFTDDTASLTLEWERWRVSIPIRVETRAQIEAGLRELDGTWRAYADLAQYMLESRRDYDAGLSLAERSVALAETWRNLWIKASLLAAKQRFPEARQTGGRAYELWQERGRPEVAGLDMPGSLASWLRGADRRPAQVVERVAAPVRRLAAAPAASPVRSAFVEPDLPGSLIAIVDERSAAARAPEPSQRTEPKTSAREGKRAPVSRRGRAPVTAPATLVMGPAEASPLLGASGAPASSELAERPVHAREPARVPGASGGDSPSQDAISRVVEQGRGDLRACYQRALRLDPSLTRGKIRLSVEIGISGRAKSVLLDAPEALRVIEPCVRSAVSHWVFPASSAEYSAELPLLLQAGE